ILYFWQAQKLLFMKKITSVLASILILSGIVSAQNPIDYTVSVTVQVQESPAQITLLWPANAGSTGYVIKRKSLTASSFTTVANIAGSATSYIDTNVVAGIGHEYSITCTGAVVAGNSYVYAGIKLPAVDYRGK